MWPAGTVVSRPGAPSHTHTHPQISPHRIRAAVGRVTFLVRCRKCTSRRHCSLVARLLHPFPLFKSSSTHIHTPQLQLQPLVVSQPYVTQLQRSVAYGYQPETKRGWNARWVVSSIIVVLTTRGEACSPPPLLHPASYFSRQGDTEVQACIRETEHHWQVRNLLVLNLLLENEREKKEHARIGTRVGEIRICQEYQPTQHTHTAVITNYIPAKFVGNFFSCLCFFSLVLED